MRTFNRFLAAILLAWMVAAFAYLIPEVVAWLFRWFERITFVRSPGFPISLDGLTTASGLTAYLALPICLIALPWLFARCSGRPLLRRPSHSGLAGGIVGAAIALPSYVVLKQIRVADEIFNTYYWDGFGHLRLSSFPDLATYLSVGALSGMTFGFCFSYLMMHADAVPRGAKRT